MGLGSPRVELRAAAAGRECLVHVIRRVRSLVDETGGRAGRHVVRWDGPDGQGKDVPSGVYFGRLVLDGQTRRKTITVLRP